MIGELIGLVSEYSSALSPVNTAALMTSGALPVLVMRTVCAAPGDVDVVRSLNAIRLRLKLATGAVLTGGTVGVVGVPAVMPKLSNVAVIGPCRSLTRRPALELALKNAARLAAGIVTPVVTFWYALPLIEKRAVAVPVTLSPVICTSSVLMLANAVPVAWYEAASLPTIFPPTIASNWMYSPVAVLMATSLIVLLTSGPRKMPAWSEVWLKFDSGPMRRAWMVKPRDVPSKAVSSAVVG